MPNEIEDRVVLIPAVLRGTEDNVAGCVIETWKERSSTGKLYTRCRIASDPPGFPDGEYVLEFADYRIRTNKYMGKWELTFLAPKIRIANAA